MALPSGDGLAVLTASGTEAGVHGSRLSAPVVMGSMWLSWLLAAPEVLSAEGPFHARTPSYAEVHRPV